MVLGALGGSSVSIGAPVGERQAGPAHRRRCDADGRDDGLNGGGRDPEPRNAGGLRQLEMARRWIVPGRGATPQPSLDFCLEGN